MDCEGDIGWVPASFIKPLYGGDNNNEDGDSIVTESFPAGKGKNSSSQLRQTKPKNYKIIKKDVLVDCKALDDLHFLCLHRR